MATENLRLKATGGMAWVGIERFGTQIVQFLTEIVIARKLSPADYGVIAMLAIFMAIAQSLIDSGFANALIQKKNRTDADYSTVFYFNLFLSVLIYLLFCITATFIANFYDTPILSDVIKIYTISLILNGLIIVHIAKLSIELDFKSQTYASILSVLISGIIGIGMAFMNYGVWSLVAQGISLAGVRVIVLWLRSKWKPTWIFSYKSFMQLFSFGSKLLVSGMINTIYQNIYTIVIGKAFNASQLGFFDRGNKFSSLPSNTITQIVLKVSYPILSSFQDNSKQLISAYEKLLKYPVYLLIPVMAALIVVSYPLIYLLLGEKWIPCVPVIQILCIGNMTSPFTHINLNLLYVKGRSDLVLKLELIKKPIAFLILFVSIPFGLIWMCVGKAFYDFIAMSLNCYYTKKILNYGLIDQIRGIKKLIINVTLMVIVSLLLDNVVENMIGKLILGLTSCALSFFVFSLVMRDKTLKEIKTVLVEYINKKKYE